MAEFFPGFEHRRIASPGASINLVTGDSGPPLLLLHGYPETPFGSAPQSVRPAGVRAGSIADDLRCFSNPETIRATWDK